MISLPPLMSFALQLRLSLRVQARWFRTAVRNAIGVYEGFCVEFLVVENHPRGPGLQNEKATRQQGGLFFKGE